MGHLYHGELWNNQRVYQTYRFGILQSAAQRAKCDEAPCKVLGPVTFCPTIRGPWRSCWPKVWQFGSWTCMIFIIYIRRPRQTQGGARQGIRQAKTSKFSRTSSKSSGSSSSSSCFLLWKLFDCSSTTQQAAADTSRRSSSKRNGSSAAASSTKKCVFLGWH